MAVKLLFNRLPQFIDANGNPYSGAKLFTYASGSTTKQTTYQESTGTTAHANPIVLNSRGEPSAAIWGTTGQTYKLVLAPSTDTDPPAASISTIDNISPINDTTVTLDQWVSGPAPTFVSSTQFTLVGDQTSTFHVGRRVKVTDAGGTKYGTITVSAFTTLTTVTITGDALATPTSAVSYGLLTTDNPSTPVPIDTHPVVSGSADKTKKLRFEVDSLTTSTTRVQHVPDFDQFLGASYAEMSGRLTLTSGTAVTTSDVTAATTVYYALRGGNRIWLYDGTLTLWKPYVFAELSVAVPATTATVYDVFVYDNAGTLTLDATAWTNDTTRATALTTQNGILVKSGATGRRYVGSFRTTGVSGQTEDSVAKRYVWNYYNRVLRPMRVLEATNSWAYTTATLRQANAAAANQLDMVIGVSEEPVKASVYAACNNTNALAIGVVAVGLDSTTTMASGCIAPPTITPSANGYTNPEAHWMGYPGIGRHTLVWLEYAEVAGTMTWYGDNNNPTIQQSGILGELLA